MLSPRNIKKKETHLLYHLWFLERKETVFVSPQSKGPIKGLLSLLYS